MKNNPSGKINLKKIVGLGYVFITGAYRSGTTLFHRLLDGHPDLFSFPVENCIFRDYLYPHLFPNPEDRNLDCLTRWLKAKKSDEILKIVFSNDKLGLPLRKYINFTGSYGNQSLLTDFDRYLFVKLFNEYMNKTSENKEVFDIKDLYIAYNVGYSLSIGIQDIDRKKLYVNKCPEQGQCINYYLENFPGSKIIHIVRDPRACIGSHKGRLSRKEFMPYDMFFKLISTNINSMRNYMDFIGTERVHCLKYEELVSNPRNVMSGIAEFLEIPFDECLLKPTILGNSWKANTSYESGNKNDGPIINSSNMERWKEKLNGLEIQCIEALSKNEMLKLGYPLGHGNLSPVNLRTLYFIKSLKSRAKSKIKRMLVPATS